MKICQKIGLVLSVEQGKKGFVKYNPISRVKLNPNTDEVGNTYKAIVISLNLDLNTVIFGCFFFLSGLAN